MTKRVIEVEYRCAECGYRAVGQEFHPYLFCELVKLGHDDPKDYLLKYGFERTREMNW